MSGGKQYAKRATMWDAVFVGIGTMSRRDEGLAAIIARYLLVDWIACCCCTILRCVLWFDTCPPLRCVEVRCAFPRRRC